MIAPTLDRETTLHLAEHEILLSFNSDYDAELFDEWWHKEGLAALQQWERKQKDTR